ncbi:hypothetical protein HX823_00480 [Pseudomonas sp. P7759]|uniref:hypothetical protein n=1 Tax=Pseudomonas sp. P7759 TaxID=2738831 RepID=UPI00159FA7AB|nr:hypothetical protein [Pseudomonas sp. P7759]NWC72546.1 hypothetical protein [Pseudomonas sp. P7759]
MTIDKAKLKALANAATPGRVHDRLDSCGGGLKYECFGDDGSLVLKVDHKNDEWGFVGDNGAADEEFFLACTPAVVLALIADNERLSTACTRAEQVINAESKAAAIATGRANLLQAERDQLKAENEALRKERDARPPFKPFHDPAIGFTGCVICGKYTNHFGLPCPKTRATADAAMGKGEQS